MKKTQAKTISSLRGHHWTKIADNKLLSLNFVSEVHINNSRRTVSISHNNWILDYLISGNIDIEIGNNIKHRRKLNTAHLYAPGTYYHERHYDTSPLHSLSISFTHGQQIGLHKWTGKDGVAIFHDEQKILADLLMQTVEIASERGNSGLWAAISMFYKIVDALHNSIQHDDKSLHIIKPETKNIHLDFVTRVNRFLRLNVHRKITLAEIAADSNVSMSTLTHRFSNETGKTPQEAHAELRMQQIKHLLSTGHRLKTIANSLGFSDMYHLSAFFKRHQGVSPREFINSVSKSTPPASRAYRI